MYSSSGIRGSRSTSRQLTANSYSRPEEIRNLHGANEKSPRRGEIKVRKNEMKLRKNEIKVRKNLLVPR